MSPPPQKKNDDLVGSLLTWMDKWRFIVIIKLVLLNNQQLYCITKSTKNGTIFSHISLGSLLSFSVWYTMDIKPTIELPQKNDRLVGSLLAWMEKWRFIVIIKLVLLVLISSLLISQQPQVARNRQYFFHQLNYDFPVFCGAGTTCSSTSSSTTSSCCSGSRTRTTAPIQSNEWIVARRPPP